MNKFDKSIERIKKNVEVQDDWMDEDFEHYKTILEALDIASELCEIEIEAKRIIDDWNSKLVSKSDIKQNVGEWEQRTDVVGFVRCSVCKDCNVYDEWIDGKKWKFCPNCGAKMKGGASS